jgi:hypothetical protein
MKKYNACNFDIRTLGGVGGEALPLYNKKTSRRRLCGDTLLSGFAQTRLPFCWAILFIKQKQLPERTRSAVFRRGDSRAFSVT